MAYKTATSEIVQIIKEEKMRNKYFISKKFKNASAAAKSFSMSDSVWPIDGSLEAPPIPHSLIIKERE